MCGTRHFCTSMSSTDTRKENKIVLWICVTAPVILYLSPQNSGVEGGLDNPHPAFHFEETDRAKSTRTQSRTACWRQSDFRLEVSTPWAPAGLPSLHELHRLCHQLIIKVKSFSLETWTQDLCHQQLVLNCSRNRHCTQVGDRNCVTNSS